MTDKKAVRGFEDLFVWQKSIQLVKHIYVLTARGEITRDFSLRDQLRRAAISVPSNIADGYERASRKEYIQFLNIAKGSAGEIRSLLRVAFEIGYLSKSDHDRLIADVVELSGSLSNHIKSLRTTL